MSSASGRPQDPTVEEEERMPNRTAMARGTRDGMSPLPAIAMPAFSLFAHDPERAIEDDRKSAEALVRFVESRPSAIVAIGQSKHLRFEAWQFIGRYYGVTASVIPGSTEAIREDGQIVGYEASAEALLLGQYRVSAADAECRFDEERGGKRQWEDKFDNQVRSMAQTRACAKALRNVLAQYVMMAGFSVTPAEEMEAERKQRERAQQQTGVNLDRTLFRYEGHGKDRKRVRNWKAWTPVVEDAAKAARLDPKSYAAKIVGHEVSSADKLTDAEYTKVFVEAKTSPQQKGSATPPVSAAPTAPPPADAQGASEAAARSATPQLTAADANAASTEQEQWQKCQICGTDVPPEVAEASFKETGRVLCDPCKDNVPF